MTPVNIYRLWAALYRLLPLMVVINGLARLLAWCICNPGRGTFLFGRDGSLSRCLACKGQSRRLRPGWSAEGGAANAE